jgi:hypothetical protein
MEDAVTHLLDAEHREALDLGLLLKALHHLVLLRLFYTLYPNNTVEATELIRPPFCSVWIVRPHTIYNEAVFI